jgi:hypothetical protein
MTATLKVSAQLVAPIANSANGHCGSQDKIGNVLITPDAAAWAMTARLKVNAQMVAPSADSANGHRGSQDDSANLRSPQMLELRR